MSSCPSTKFASPSSLQPIHLTSMPGHLPTCRSASSAIVSVASAISLGISSGSPLCSADGCCFQRTCYGLSFRYLSREVHRLRCGHGWRRWSRSCCACLSPYRGMRGPVLADHPISWHGHTAGRASEYVTASPFLWRLLSGP